jgi:hypothetical protein
MSDVNLGTFMLSVLTIGAEVGRAHLQWDVCVLVVCLASLVARLLRPSEHAFRIVPAASAAAAGAVLLVLCIATFCHRWYVTLSFAADVVHRCKSVSDLIVLAHKGVGSICRAAQHASAEELVAHVRAGRPASQRKQLVDVRAAKCRYLAQRELVLMLVWGCMAHLVVMLVELVPRWTPLWASRVLALETALCVPVTFRVGAGHDCRSSPDAPSWQ